MSLFFFFFSWLESGFKPILDPSIPSESPVSFYRIVTSLFHLRGRLSFISFICSLVACLLFIFWLRGWLMWVYPTVQAVNVDLSMQSVINPSTQKPSLHPSYLSACLQLTYNSPFLFSCSSRSRCIHSLDPRRSDVCNNFSFDS